MAWQGIGSAQLLLVSALALTGCDQRACIRSHVEHREASIRMQPIVGGSSTKWMMVPVPAHDVTVCDEREPPHA